ncbi:hypothetical protein FALCPG4_017697 [Fusarium falciforme]
MSLPTRPEPTAQSSEAVQLQPRAHQPMDAQRPQPNEQAQSDTKLSLRGGRAGEGSCPGRFCGIPCPLNCSICIIPIPCCC